ncbi:hypothetical protein [Bacillus sp. JJ1474]|uniref:hypothetical protein n=1 Tax=Bacillus sp. JJ1474 TaxID=3122955 RepID=UPI002FFF74E7
MAGFFDLIDVIEDEGIIGELYAAYQESIRKGASFLAQEKEMIEFFKKADEYANAEDVEGMMSLYSEQFPDYANLKEELEPTFKDFDVKYETTVLEVQYFIDGTAIVIQDEMATIDQVEELKNTYVYYLEKDETGNWKLVDILDVQ